MPHRVSDQTAGDRHDSVSESCAAERLRQQIGREAQLVMLINHPRLKYREKEGSCDAYTGYEDCVCENLITTIRMKNVAGSQRRWYILVNTSK